MTPATGGHPSPEEVDALLDPGPVDARVAGHVDECAACRDLRDGMQQVRALLREHGGAEIPLPAGVEERLHAALARESASRGDVGADGASSGADGEAHVGAGTIVPLDAGRARRGARRAHGGERTSSERVPRWLTVAAGLALIGGAGAAASQLVDGSGADSSASLAQAGAGQDDAAEALTGFEGVTASGTEYDADRLGDQVGDLLAASQDDLGAMSAPQEEGEAQTLEGAAEDAASARSMLTPTGGLADDEVLASCLAELDAPGQVPVAVDLGSWEGEDAAVIVLDPPGGAGAMEVWVVGAACGRDGDRLLHYQSVQP